MSGSVRALITNTGRKNEVLLLCGAAITFPAKGEKNGGEDFFSFGIGLNLFENLYCLMVAGVLFEGRLFSVSAPVISYMVFLVTLCASERASGTGKV